jgi:hypothetical protein
MQESMIPRFLINCNRIWSAYEASHTPFADQIEQSWQILTGRLI